jgi:hypothetical protein
MSFNGFHALMLDARAVIKGATLHVRHVSGDIPKSCLLAGSQLK